MPADKRVETRHIRLPGHWIAVSPVHLLHLCTREIVQLKARADIEGGLVQVLDEQVGFGRIGQYYGELSPLAGEVIGTLVVPGAKHGEYVSSVIAFEEPVRLIDDPDQRAGHGRQHIPAQKPLKALDRAEIGLEIS